VLKGMFGGEWTQNTTNAYQTLSNIFGDALMGKFEMFVEGINTVRFAITDMITVVSAMFGGEWTQATTDAWASLNDLFGPQIMGVIEQAAEIINGVISSLSATFSDAQNPVEGLL